MLIKIHKNRSVSSAGTWGTKNENNYEILDFEFPEELKEYNKRIVYYLGNQKVWDPIIDNKAILTNAITTKGSVKAYIWCTKSDEAFETDVDFRTQIFVMNFFENDNADGIVPTEEQVDGFNTMLTAMNAKIDEVDALEQTIGAAEAQRQEAEATRVSNENTRETNESTRQTNEQTRQSQEAERKRRTDKAIEDIKDKTAEYNANAEAKTNEFNQNATQKTNEFNANYTQKVNDFNSNATSKTNEFNDLVETKKLVIENYGDTQLNAIGKKGQQALGSITTTTQFALQNISLAQQTGVSAVETASSEATTNFNTNAESKTTEFNTNATSKTNDFNDNATEKTTAFNQNAQNKIDEYDEHIVDYQAQIDELQEEVDELSENMPWNTTEQATEISVDDAAKYSKNKLELFGNTEQASYSGKNLLPGQVYEFCTITANGGKTFTPQRYCSDFIKIDNALTYYLSANTILGFFGVAEYDNDYNYIERQYWNEAKEHIITNLNSNAKYIKIFAETKSGILAQQNQFSIYKVQLEQNSTATDYEPYVGGVPTPNPSFPQDIHVVSGNNTISVGNTNYPINLGSLELCKIGDYQDYFYKENGNWYENKKIGKLILTENANVASSQYGTNSYNLFIPVSHLMEVDNTKIMVLSNKYKAIPYNDRTQEISNSIFQTNYNNQIFFRNTEFASVENFKTNNIGTILYLVLKNATTTQITDETLIAQLDAIYEHLQLVKGTNNITVTAEDLAPNMKLTYMQDIKSKLDNLDSRLALLE